ncbi:MAG: DUF4440 domain-containing protein [Bacteroidales bacterium]|nr:DUF4440 domain-containing protein [Bacteroidales bacterium]
MKYLKSHFGLQAALFTAAFLITSCTQAPVDVTREIEEANKAFLDIRKSGDPEAMSMLYTRDAKLLPANGVLIDGREAITAYWSTSMAQEASSELALETVSAIGYGDIAIEEGRYKVRVGSQEVDMGKYIVTWKKEDGQWKLHQDIWNSDLPLPTARASAGDTVWVVWNKIKADKVSQFEEFNFSYLEPAIAENYPIARSTVRSLKPVEPNKDGTYTYFYLMDPAISPDGYGMATFLTTKFGKEKSDEYMKMFQDCLVDEQEWVVTVQTEW